MSERHNGTTTKPDVKVVSLLCSSRRKVKKYDHEQN